MNLANNQLKEVIILSHIFHVETVIEIKVNIQRFQIAKETKSISVPAMSLYT